MWIIDIAVVVTVAGMIVGTMKGSYDIRFEQETECVAFIHKDEFKEDTKKFIAHKLVPMKLPDDARLDIDIKCVKDGTNVAGLR